MRKLWTAAVAVFLTLGVAGSVRADDQAEIKALLDQAIKASGGEEKLTSHRATEAKIKGKFYGQGEGIDFTGSLASQLPSQSRLEIQLDAGGMKFTVIQVLNGDKGWAKINDDLKELSKEEVAEGKHSLYLGSVLTLVPLAKDKEFTLAPLGEDKIAGRVVVGIRVTRKGQRDINLYFDKEKGLLARSETTVKDFMNGGGQEFKQEYLYSDYKNIDGRPVAMKVEIKRDGKPFIESENVEIKLPEKIDDSVFGKP